MEQWHDTNSNSAWQEPCPGQCFFRDIPFAIHRFSPKTSSLTRNDYLPIGDEIAIPDVLDHITLGASCFVPITPNHLYNTPNSANRRTECGFLVKGYTPPDGLVFVFTDAREYRHPGDAPTQYRKIWYFTICCTSKLPADKRKLKTKGNERIPEQLDRYIQQMSWNDCTIRGAAEPPKLTPASDDLNNQQSQILCRLYKMMESLCEDTNEPATCFLANEVHTFIAFLKPSMSDLLQRKPLCRDLFELLCVLDLEGGADECRFQVLQTFEDEFGWDWQPMYHEADRARRCYELGRTKESINGLSVPRKVACTYRTMHDLSKNSTLSLEEIWEQLERNGILSPLNSTSDKRADLLYVPPVTYAAKFKNEWKTLMRYYSCKSEFRLFTREKADNEWRYSINETFLPESATTQEWSYELCTLWEEESSDLSDGNSPILDGSPILDSAVAAAGNGKAAVEPASLRLLHDEKFTQILRGIDDEDATDLVEIRYNTMIPDCIIIKENKVKLMLFLDSLLWDPVALHRLTSQWQHVLQEDYDEIQVTICTWKDNLTAAKSQAAKRLLTETVGLPYMNATFGVINTDAKFERWDAPKLTLAALSTR
ncbi:hypothetical protein DFS34DRAFT_595708 [Phlyctochytrium arcticum]|nr:hypothetical protein DFS34DRAFT_595708 [Phlyctochytrium arcticum]